MLSGQLIRRHMCGAGAALLVTLALASCGSSSSPFQVTEVVHATRVYQNGPKQPLTVTWVGAPVFPITEHVLGAASGLFERQFPGPDNPAVWPEATSVVGNLDPSTPPSTENADLWLTDANGVATNHVTIHTTFYYSPVSVAFEDIIVAPLEPAIDRTLRAPNQVSWSAGDVARSVVLAAGGLLLIAFPSQLFNSTLQAHYGEVMGWFGFVRRPLRRFARWSAQPAAPAGGAWHTRRWAIALAVLLGALFGALLDPHFGFNSTSAEGFLGILVAVLVTTALYTSVTAVALRRMARARGRLRVYGGGIAIALGCLLISRLTSAQPGYLYGVMLGYALAGSVSLTHIHEGRLVALSSAVVLVISVATWLLWTPVKHAADTSGGFAVVAVSTAMAGIFLGGMTSLLFGLLPLRFLDGEKLLSWRRALWVALVAAGLFLFVHVVLNVAAGSADSNRPYAVTIALFCAFGLFSVAFWAYFRYRRAPTG